MGVSATLEFDVNDAMTVKSITSFRKLENLLYLDADGGALRRRRRSWGRFHLFQDQQQHQASARNCRRSATCWMDG